MTVRLIVAFNGNPANAIVTFDGATEAALIVQKLATATLTGGVVYPANTPFGAGNSLRNNPVTGAQVGDGSATLPNATAPLLACIGSADSYMQAYAWNKSTGVNASGDFIAYPDNGADAAGWSDFGMNSSTFAQAAYAISGPNEGYFFVSAPAGAAKTGNMVIATDSTGTANKIRIGTGGFNSTANIRCEISATGLAVIAAGAGLAVKEGTNCKQGTATLVAGVVTVSNTAVTANSRVFVQRQTDGGTVAASYSITRTAGVSLTITARDGAGAAQTLDTSTLAYQMFEPG